MLGHSTDSTLLKQEDSTVSQLHFLSTGWVKFDIDDNFKSPKWIGKAKNGDRYTKLRGWGGLPFRWATIDIHAEGDMMAKLGK